MSKLSDQVCSPVEEAAVAAAEAATVAADVAWLELSNMRMLGPSVDCCCRRRLAAEACLSGMTA